ncbi:MAG: RiPP maturation radical SAM protein 1 [Actinobacteria bacterium]|nr:RiPP maturation radical SAM protein 1 [Actinomycetota bacterium]
MSTRTSRGAREGAPAQPRVLLLSMPFAALERPALGPSLLQARLRRDGFVCDLRYLAFDFAGLVGLHEYLWIQSELPYTAFAGDWTFTESLYGERKPLDTRYLEEVLRQTWRLDDESVARVLRVRAYCGPFLDHCVGSIDWSAYEVVGFTSTFEQNLASLALAHRVKAAQPEVRIVFGGANWEGEMGIALHQHFPFVDFVCSGEADESFPALLRCLATGDDVSGVPGVVHRLGDATSSTGPAALVRDLDALPLPDYDDFAIALEESAVAAEVTPVYLLETSRGCWWGAKHHCTFCGLNGGAMAFRSKSVDRAIEEIRRLQDRYGAESLSVVDNILDMRYFRTLLPRLVEEEIDVSLFYEVKANLTHDQVAQLAAAGVRHVQPGIESMSDHVLALMRKGTTALQNVQLLKWCRELGVTPEWNLLYGFPGEEPEDYEAMLPLLEAIQFLDPPCACGPVRLDRFSPYHDDPAGFGMIDVRPLTPYRHLYPFSDDAVARIAYYFDFGYAHGREPERYARPVIEYVRDWIASGPRGALWLSPAGAEGLTLVRDRPDGSRETFALAGWQADVYLACDRIRSRRRLAALVPAAAAALDSFLSWCVHEQLLLADGDRCLALAVQTPARRSVAEARVAVAS